MQLQRRSLLLFANAFSLAAAFTSPPAITSPPAVLAAPLSATTAGSDAAARLLAKARALREAVAASEDELHSTLLEKKATKDKATDAIIACLFPPEEERRPEEDGGEGNYDVAALCDRLRSKRLASDALVSIVERLHEREVAAKGFEHVEPSKNDGDSHVTFRRVAEEDEEELERVGGLVGRLVRAAEVLDVEFKVEKELGGGIITHSDMMHWGGGNMAGIIKDKANELGREHDEQFQKRLESFYDAAKRKHKREEVNRDSWMDGDVWSP